MPYSLVRRSQEGSPLLKSQHSSLTQSLIHGATATIHICMHAFTAVHPHTSVIHMCTHTHAYPSCLLCSAEHFWMLNHTTICYRQKDLNDLFRQRKPELFCCFTCWIYASHSLRVLMLHYGCVEWEHCIDYDVSALFFLVRFREWLQTA